MIWKKYTIHTTEEAEDLVSAALYELGITSVEIEDKRPASEAEMMGLFGDVVPEMPEDDHLAQISFYLECPGDEAGTEAAAGDAAAGDEAAGDAAEEESAEAAHAEILNQVRASLKEMRSYADIGEGTITTSRTQEEDWVNNWKQYFHQFRVDDLLIVPSWEEPELQTDGAADQTASAGSDAAGGVKHLLRIDPGTAFGTGKHETTQLAIRALRKYLKSGDRVLDIGTGSGILGIIALKEGASEVFGTDIDPQVIPAIEDNLERNGMTGCAFNYVIGNIVDDPDTQAAVGRAAYGRAAFGPGVCGSESAGFDICVSNIIAEILTGITPQAARFLKKGGLFLTSGILTGHEQLVYDAMAQAGMTVIETARQGDWFMIAARSY